VRIEHGIDVVNARRHQLQPQLRWRVNEQSRTGPRLNDCATPRPLVARVGGAADITATTDLRHAETRAGTEKGEAHGGCQRPHPRDTP